MTEYTCALAFTPGDEKYPDRPGKLALIKKTHPVWQAGRFNGIGGKLEPDERPDEANVREFAEETGVFIPASQWRHFLTLTDGETWTVYFFTVTSGRVRAVRTMTEEKIERREAEWWLQMGLLVPNLKWIIPLAMQSEHFAEAAAVREKPIRRGVPCEEVV
jgi:8-oxo-dGTP diphosphatase